MEVIEEITLPYIEGSEWLTSENLDYAFSADFMDKWNLLSHVTKLIEQQQQQQQIKGMDWYSCNFI